MGFESDLLRKASDESVREVKRGRDLAIYRRYISKTRASGDVALEEENCREYRWYDPLQDPQLFVSFARLPEPVTESVMLRWISDHGELGNSLSSSDDGGRLSDFREETHDARRILTLYELATAEYANATAIANVLGPLENTAIGLDVWPLHLDIQNRTDAVRLALGEVELMVRDKLRLHTHADLSMLASGSSEPTLGFHNLLGAIYIQARALLTVQTVRRCQAPDCIRVIPPGSYRNKVYCSGACKHRLYDRKKAAR